MRHLDVLISQYLLRDFLKRRFTDPAELLIEHVHLSSNFIARELALHIFELVVEFIEESQGVVLKVDIDYRIIHILN